MPAGKFNRKKSVRGQWVAIGVGAVLDVFDRRVRLLDDAVALALVHAAAAVGESNGAHAARCCLVPITAGQFRATKTFYSVGTNGVRSV